MIIPRERKISFVDVEVTDADVEALFNESNLSKKDLIREKTSKQKNNIRMREEVKTTKKEAGKNKKERNRREKEISTTLRYSRESTFFTEGSQEQLERFAKAKANALKRKSMAKKESIPDSHTKYLERKAKKAIEGDDKLSSKAALKAAIARAELKSAEDDVDALFGLSEDDRKIERVPFSELKEVLCDSSEEEFNIVAIEDESKVLELDVPIPVEPKIVKKADKTNKLGFTKLEVKEFSDNALAKKREKRARKLARRVEAKALSVKSDVPYSTIPSLKEAFSTDVKPVKKHALHLVTESGEKSPEGLTEQFLSIMDSNTRCFVVFLYQIYRSRDSFDYAAAALQYLHTLDLARIPYAENAAKSLVDCYSGFMDRWTPKEPLVLNSDIELMDIKSDNITEAGIVDDISSMFRSFIEGDLIVGLKNFFIALAGMKLLGAQFTGPVFKLFGGFGTKLSIVDFIDKLLDSAKVLMRFGSALIAGVPLTSALMSKDPVNATIERVEYLIKFRDQTYTGLPSPGKINLHAYITELEENVKVLNYAYKNMGAFTSVKSRVKTLLMESSLVLNEKKSLAYASTRTVPFGLVLTGDSSIGKGYLLKYFARVWSKIKGREFKADHIFPRSATSQYWEGYDPWANPIIHYSEVARFTKQYTKAKGDNQIDELISLIDSMVFKPDMAFDGKGKVNAFPELVMCDTNNETLNADCMYFSQVAYLRRFVFIVPSVLEEFRKVGSTAIDPAKSNASDRHILDKYSFEVYKVKGDANGRVVKDYVGKQLNLKQVTVLMAKLFKEHVLANEATSAKVEEAGLLGDVTPIENPVMGSFDVYREDLNSEELSNLTYDEDEAFSISEELDMHNVNEDYTELLETKDYLLDVAADVEHVPFDKVDAINLNRVKTARDRAEYETQVREVEELRKKNFWAQCRTNGVSESEIEDLYSHYIASDTELSSSEDEKNELESGEYSLVTQAGEYFSMENAFDMADKIFKLLSATADVTLCVLMLIFTWFVQELMKEGEGHYSFNPYRFMIFLGIYSYLDTWKASLLLPFFMVHYSFIITKFGFLVATQVVVAVEKRSCNALGRLRSRFFGEVYNPFVTNLKSNVSYARIARMIAAATLAIATYKVATGVYRHYKTGHSLVTEADEDDEAEEGYIVRYTMGASSDDIVVPSKLNKFIWNDRVTVNSRIRSMPVHTSGLKELYSSIKANTRYCEIEHPGKDAPVGHTFCYGVKGAYAIINAHPFRKSEEVTLKVSTSSCHKGGAGWNTFKFRPKDAVRITDDAIMVEVPGMRFKDVIKHFSDEHSDSDVRMVINNELTRGCVVDTPVSASDKHIGVMSINSPIKYDCNHYSGLCGSPVVGEFRNGHIIYGIHFAGNKTTKLAFGVKISKTDLENALDIVSANSLFPIASQSGECITQSGEVEVGMRALGDLEEPGFKSITRYEHLPQMEYFGKIKGPIMMPKKSNLEHTAFANEVVNFFSETLGYKDFEIFGKPVMKPKIVMDEHMEQEWRSPHNINLRKMAKNKKSLKHSTLKKVRDQLADRIISMLEAQGITRLTPLTIEEAINGLEDDPFFRRINASTSAGFGFPGAKYDHLPFEEDSDTKRIPTPELREKVEAMLKLYREGKSVHPIYSGKLKDEPRSQSKIDACKTRMFFMQALDHLIVSRMFLAPFYTLMVKYGDIFGTSVGVNMFTDADKMYKDMKDFSDDIIEGDYGGYDVSMPHGVGETVNGVIMKVLKHFGYDEESLTITRGILTDNLFPYVEVLLDVFCVPGLQPSGKYATAEDNSLRGIVLLMYAWIEMGFKGNFFDYVFPKTYGDDLVAASKEKDFNNVSYAEFVKREYGMDFTDPNKKEVFDPFVTPETMSFLKRHFKFDSNFGRYVAFLPVETFVKALMWTIPSRYVTAEQQVVSTCASMCYEFAMFDSDKFDIFRNFLIRQLVDKYEFTELEAKRKLPLFADAHNIVTGAEQNSPPLQWASDSDTEIDELSLELVLEGGIVERHHDIRSLLCVSQITRSANFEEIKEMKELEISIRENPYHSVVFGSGKPLHEALHHPRIVIPDDYRRDICRYADLRITYLRLHENDFSELITESGEMEVGSAHSNTILREQNFEDIMGDVEEKVDAGNSLYPDIGQSTHLSLDEFFARPIEIYTDVLQIGVHSSTVFNPWIFFLNKPAIRAKLKNYSFFSADLHVRVEISGTPFHYGRVLLSYQPLARSNACLTKLQTNLLANATFRPLLLNYLSQAPGAVTMDIKSNKPVEMTLPFICSKPMWRLFNPTTTTLASTTDYDDSHNAGQLFMYTINPAQTTSVGASEPRYQIFAWASNVKLGTATGTVIQLATEAGEYDERERGPIEKFSSAAMEVTAALSKVPIIAPHAKASNTLFMGLRSLASIFGFSKPVENGEPSLVKMNPFQNGANVIGMDTAKRITLDPKQELSVDPRVMGVDTDDMVISEIAKKNSYLTTFTWTPNAIVMQPLWKSRVTPELATLTSNAQDVFVQPTACMFAVSPFRYWNGKVVFRFEFVVSSFHRGKVAIFVDPNVSQAAAITFSPQLNKQYMTVIDIQETQTVDIAVNWQSPRYWAQTIGDPRDIYGSSMQVGNQSYCNGFIFIVPFTSLQSNDDSTVEVNVYARCENMRVNVLGQPRKFDGRSVWTESGLVTEAGEINGTSDTTYVEVNKNFGSLAMCSEYHFGEEPVSFRSLLKRYTTTYTAQGLPDPAFTFGEIWLQDRNFPINRFPYGPPAAQYSMNLFNYLQYAYVGAKGGLRKRVRVSGNFSSNDTLNHTVIHPIVYTNDQSESISTQVATSSPIELVGGVTFIPHNNGGIEYEVPFYSINLFFTSFADDMIGFTLSDEIIKYWNIVSNVRVGISGPFSDFAVDVQTAAAEDFTFMRFQGAPYYTFLL